MILCQACSSALLCRQPCKKAFHVGKRKEEWVSAWETTTTTASQISDFVDEVLLFASSEYIQKRQNSSATRARTVGKKLRLATPKSRYQQEKKAQNIFHKTITFQHQETTEIRNRIMAAWATFRKYKQELTSKSYMLRHRLRLFDTEVSPTMNYAS